MVTISEVERLYAEMLGKVARAQLPHLDWEEAEPHLIVGWKSGAHAANLQWSDVSEIVRQGWERGEPST